jgi:hypothetical protein
MTFQCDTKGIENFRSEKHESVHTDDILSQYQFMQSLILTGKLPCTKDEASTLGAIQLRIYELSYQSKAREEEYELRERESSKNNDNDNEDASKEICSGDGAETNRKSLTASHAAVMLGEQMGVLNQIDERTEVNSLASSDSNKAARVSVGTRKNLKLKEEINKLVRSTSEISKQRW